MIFNRNTRYYQWLVTLLFVVAIAIAMSGHSYVTRLLNRVKPVAFLGELSLSIYLVHSPLIDAYGRLCSHWGVDNHFCPAAFAALIVFFAVLHLYLTKYAMRLCSSLFQKLKHGLTVTDT